VPPDSRAPIDELLRRFLDADPGEALAALRLSVERIQDSVADLHADVASFKREVESRFRSLEHPSGRPPTMHDLGSLGKLVTSTGSWDTSAIDRVISQREAAAALARQKAIVGVGLKVGTALLIAVLLFAGGSFWRDLWGPRPASSTNITTIAPQAPGK
jgi:hypothetical protein